METHPTFIFCIFAFAFFQISPADASKAYNGQRTFVDARIVNFVDPAKHGFHIILDDDFVRIHLQPVHLPTVYATAVALKPFPVVQEDKNDTATSHTRSRLPSAPQMRTTKILYPENEAADDSIVDGRTIKLLGLQERSWYYVCVEFESNLNRHEIATGSSCQLARTLDKFGKNAASTISEIALNQITDRSISLRLTVDTDFPLRLSTYFTNGQSRDGAFSPTVPAQVFLLKNAQVLNVEFTDQFLRPDTDYGQFCVYEEPLVDVYTAMGRSAKSSIENCYFTNLKTKPESGFSGKADIFAVENRVMSDRNADKKRAAAKLTFSSSNSAGYFPSSGWIRMILIAFSALWLFS